MTQTALSFRTQGVPFVVWVIGLVPLLALVVRAVTGNLGANPIDTLTEETGEWALRFLVLSLAITPVRRIGGWPALAPLRREFGLLAFAYAASHALTYVVLDQFFHVPSILADLAKRPFIMAGAATFVVLLVLAITSTRRMTARLGGKRWIQLHRLAYVAAIGAVVHYWWLVKADIRGPLVFAAIVGVLLVLRLWWRLQPRVPS